MHVCCKCVVVLSSYIFPLRLFCGAIIAKKSSCSLRTIRKLFLNPVKAFIKLDASTLQTSPCAVDQCDILERLLADELYQSGTRGRYTSGTGGSYISRSSAADRFNTDTYSRRYNYRSRSDMGPGGLTPRRYASQTLLDGSRPGPTTPHWRKDALETLQKELDTLSRSPAGDRSVKGYSSDTGYMNDTIRSRIQQGYDYGMMPWRRGRSTARDYYVTRVACSKPASADASSAERIVI